MKLRQIKIVLLVVATFSLSSCGNFKLGNVQPQSGKSADQQQLDTLSCKDQARLAANATGKQVGDFLLGMTIIGTPFAYENDKKLQRDTFIDCMSARGYQVTPADDRPSGGTQNSSNITGAQTPVVTDRATITKVKLEWPEGWSARDIPSNLKNNNVVLSGWNKTIDSGVLVASVSSSGITNLNSYAISRTAIQANNVDNARSSPVQEITINGIKIFQSSVTGNLKTGNKSLLTWTHNFFDVGDEIVDVVFYTTAANMPHQSQELGRILGQVKGLQ